MRDGVLRHTDRIGGQVVDARRRIERKLALDAISRGERPRNKRKTGAVRPMWLEPAGISWPGKRNLRVRVPATTLTQYRLLPL